MWFYRSDGETAEDVVENFTKIQQLSSEDENSGPKSKEPKAEDNNKPSKKKKYPKLGSYNEFKSYEQGKWPSKEECVSHVTRFPEWANLPTVYLPPDHKGFEIQKIINEDINLDQGTPHPLPWFPPHCDAEKAESLKLDVRYADLPGFNSQQSKEKFPDEAIKGKFLFSFGKLDGQENIAELGARIKTAMEREAWPSWLLNLLAANYWRIIGNSGASVTCYSLALQSTPVQYKDLVLTNLGALLYRLGHVDSALKLLHESVAVCDTEPETHFFLANLLSAKVRKSPALCPYIFPPFTSGQHDRGHPPLQSRPQAGAGLPGRGGPAEDPVLLPQVSPLTQRARHHPQSSLPLLQGQQPHQHTGQSQGASGPPGLSWPQIYISHAQKCQPRAQCCKPVQQAGCGAGRERRSCSCNSCNIPAQPQPSYEVSLTLACPALLSRHS